MDIYSLDTCSCYTYHSDALTVTEAPIYWTLNEHVSAWLSTPLLHVSVLSLYRQSSTLNTVFHVSTSDSRYCCSMYIYHCYTDTDSLDIIISCSWTTDIRIRYFTGYRYTDTLYTIVCSYITVTKIHLYTYDWLFLYSCCMVHCSCYLDYWYLNIHVLLLYYILVHVTVTAILIKILLTC